MLRHPNRCRGRTELESSFFRPPSGGLRFALALPFQARAVSEAQAIIAKIMAPNEKVEAYGPLPEAAVEALGLKPGEFRSA
jgi:hypothetical protein